MSAPPLHTSAPLALPTVLKAVADPRELCVVGALTSPGVDRAGDLVRPEGLDFTSHRANPAVDLEHARDPAVRDAVVGWCRKSLSRPGGDYGVRWSTVDVPGHGSQRLPFAWTWFDPSDRLQSQVFSLYEQGALTGYSLEFRPVTMKAIGWSDLDGRPAYDFRRCDVVRYTCCAVPVCEGALVAADGVIRKSLAGQVPEPLRKILADNRVGGEPLHPVIAKAYRLTPTRTVVRVEKAMDEQTVYDEAAPELTGADDHAEPDGDEGPANNGVSALYAKAQALSDAADALEADIESSDSPELYKLAAKFCADARALAEKVKGAADKHDAKLQAMKKGDDYEPDEPDDGDDDGDEPADMATDEDGTFKAVRRCYKSILKAIKSRKYTLAEISKGMAAAPAPAPQDDPETVRKKARLLKLISGNNEILKRTRV